MRPDTFIEPLLKCLKMEGQHQILSHAALCLTNLVDIYPELAEEIHNQNGIKIIGERCLEIEFIDVAENCIKLLDKIAETFPAQVVKSEAVMTFFNTLDFFEASIQDRVINLVKKLTRGFK
jgi:E3 ubiquitin-protein ligase TRIP12